MISLQSDTDNLITAADLQHDGALHLGAESPQRRLQAAKLPNPQQYSTPAIQIPTRFRSTAAGAANSDHAYQRSMYGAAEQRNLLLKRAYDVISNLQVCCATHAPLRDDRESCQHCYMVPVAHVCISLIDDNQYEELRAQAVSGCPLPVGQQAQSSGAATTPHMLIAEQF